MTGLPAVEALCAIEHPYRSDSECDRLFDAAMAELTLYHAENSPGYRQWLTQNGFDPTAPSGSEAAPHGPPIFASYFKHRVLTTRGTEDALELTSSGTTGQRSRMRYDARSLQAARRMVDRIFLHHGWATPDQPCNYLLLGYEPAGATSLGTTHTGQFLCRYAPVQRVFHVLRRVGGGHEFDAFGTVRVLQECAEEGLPVRILGFPAFLAFALQRMRQMRLPALQLHPDSLVFLGGGWKTHADQAISRAELYQRLGEQLGLPDARCRDGYGSVEHPVPYVECDRHRFHVPSYARAHVLDTATLARRPFGEPGFLQLASPYITSSPAHNLVTSDLAALYPAAACGCGLPTPWFELLGRAGTRPGRSCAMAASELIRNT